MVTISNVGVIGVPVTGTGILSPQRQNRFRVRFTDLSPADNLVLSMQISSAGYQFVPKEAVIVLQQPEQSPQFLPLLTDLIETRFDLAIDMIDVNDTVQQSVCLLGCCIEAHTTELDYASHNVVEHCLGMSYDAYVVT